MSGANLRGQGADATLVLLNGRRVAAHGLAGQVVDLNSIPFAAIERVEVLRDGASAVYGTDAIGGVINFITRSNYQGITVTAGADVTQEGGGNIYHGSLLGGWGDLDNDRWNVWAALNVKKNKILRGNQRDFVNSFQPDRGLSPDTRGTPFANIVNGTGSMIGGGLGEDPSSNLTKTTINTLRLPGGAGCENGGDMMGDYGDKIWASPGASFGCAWDYGRARTIQQPVDTVQGIGRPDRHRWHAGRHAGLFAAQAQAGLDLGMTFDMGNWHWQGRMPAAGRAGAGTLCALRALQGRAAPARQVAVPLADSVAPWRAVLRALPADVRMPLNTRWWVTTLWLLHETAGLGEVGRLLRKAVCCSRPRRCRCSRPTTLLLIGPKASATTFCWT